jgi:fructose-1-phosphate kinase PfkB-like protein
MSEPRFSPSRSSDDLAKAESYLRKRSKLRMGDERVVVDLARDEATRRNAEKVLRVSWLSLAVSVVSAVAAFAAAVAAVFTYLARRS